ncbi:tyrosine-type recombinase/integrase [Cellulomonas fengjieae]|uniref:Core-binding (CB) domain-containing protein n=1 Tax=Cellulomonas fengjieae TaxID=2819978 RepID=A0ABS3SLJ4_9CELL|nr:hypothetical protein [Cellulomonas fengjieae]MBO3086625.1 hypothetical protein [Cellulomonas fengjieae]QVI66526.1 hypothetical protein KG102_02650 [Cellulomonas fengjieae]
MTRPTVKKTAVKNHPGIRKVTRTHADGRQVSTYEARVKDERRRLTSLGQFASLSAARAAQTTSKADVQRGAFVAPSAGRTTFLEVAEGWLQTPKLQKAKPSTMAAYRQIVHGSLKPLHGVAVNRLDYRRLSTFLGNYSTDEKGRPRAARTVQKTAGVLSRVLNEAVKGKLIAINPMREIDLAKPDDAPRHWLTEGQVAQVIAWLRTATVTASPRGQRATAANSTTVPMPERAKWAALVFFAAYTGARAGEVAGLRVSDLNLLARTARIERSAQYVGGGWHVGTPKSRAGIRTLAGLPRELVADLATLVATLRPSDYVFSVGWTATVCRTPITERTSCDECSTPRLKLSAYRRTATRAASVFTTCGTFTRRSASSEG